MERQENIETTHKLRNLCRIKTENASENSGDPIIRDILDTALSRRALPSPTNDLKTI
jgi:hypothetical protein